ncbi:hypothetical protein LY78DRAFT_346647 [Colletotrichum sublineola]|nr:hypothetical protein LY78DRAFT_346647 [Colletotrichum sublineola]
MLGRPDPGELGTNRQPICRIPHYDAARGGAVPMSRAHLARCSRCGWTGSLPCVPSAALSCVTRGSALQEMKILLLTLSTLTI